MSLRHPVVVATLGWYFRGEICCDVLSRQERLGCLFESFVLVAFNTSALGWYSRAKIHQQCGTRLGLLNQGHLLFTFLFPYHFQEGILEEFRYQHGVVARTITCAPFNPFSYHLVFFFPYHFQEGIFEEFHY